MTPSVADRLAKVARRKTVRLTHYGRKSGRPYQVTIWFLVDGDTVYLVTMNMDRQWTRNVQQRPEVQLDIGGDRFEAVVEHVVTDDAEMRRVVALLKRKYLVSRPYMWLKKRPDGAFRLHVEE